MDSGSCLFLNERVMFYTNPRNHYYYDYYYSPLRRELFGQYPETTIEEVDDITMYPPLHADQGIEAFGRTYVLGMRVSDLTVG